MIQTNQAWKNAVLSDIDASTYSATFGFMPEGSKENATFSVSSQAVNSKSEQINNGVNQMGALWGTNEIGRVKCDGKTSWIKDTGQVGAFFAPISDENGLFNEDVSITYTLNTSYDLIGISVYFDDKGNEYATSVKITYYNNANSVITEKIFDNDSALGIFNLPQTGVKSFKVTILKWNVPFRMAKISQISPGQFYLFDSTNVYSVELEEETYPFEYFDYEQRIEFDNSDSQFDIVNPTGLASFLRTNMQFTTTMTDGDTISMGNWYLSQWNEQSNDATGFFVIKPKIFTDSRKYPNYTDSGTQNVETAINTILDGYEWNSDINLTQIVNKYIGNDVSIINAMEYISMATGAYWICNRDGSYTLKSIDTNVVRDVDFDTAFISPNISQNSLITGIIVKHYYSSTLDGTLDLKQGETLVGDETGTTKTISTPFLRSADATRIGEIALAWYQKRLAVTTEMKGDVSLQPLDVVSVEHSYGNLDVIITEVRTSWSEKIIESDIRGVNL